MASYSVNPSSPENQSTIDNTPEIIESDAEDEVDQLDSDSEVDESGNDVHMKTSDPAEGQRMPGHSLLPPMRLENIIQAEGILHISHLSPLIFMRLKGVTGNLALSKEGLFILSIAAVRGLGPNLTFIL